MDSIKNIAIGGAITLLIGGTAYTFNQADVIQNFADDTGLTQEQAEQYINQIPEEELVEFDELGYSEIEYGQELIAQANQIDCVNYEYEWESTSLSCFQGKTQLQNLARDNVLLGQAYVKLASDSASEVEMIETIRLIDKMNLHYDSKIASYIYSWSQIDEIKKTNSFNKSLLKSALESE